jgi:hypothetical protein
MSYRTAILPRPPLKFLHEHLPAPESNTAIKNYWRMLGQLRNTTITTPGGFLGHCYSSVRFIRIPYAKNQHLFSKQLRSFDSLIREAASDAEVTKTEAGYLLTSEIQRRMFKAVFEHYEDNLEKPFDFLENLFSVRPVEDSFSDTFLPF